MKLYHSPQSRSGRPLWLLEEIGAPFELVKIDLAAKQHKSPEYLKIHPHGVVPAFVDGDFAMFESAAICMYLADKFPEKRLAPPVGSTDRGRYYQWMVYSMATLEPPIIQVFMNTVMLPENQRSPQAADEGRKQFEGIGQVLDEALQGKEYLVGNQFTAADVMVGSTLIWASFMGLIAAHPVLQDYCNRLMARPAYQRGSAR